MLVNCVVYREGKKIADAVAPQKIRHYLDQPGCFVWVALNEPEPAELAQMEKEFGLHELAVEDVRLGHHRPKIEEYADALFVVLHTVECAADELKVGEVNIFAGPNYVLSLRYRTERGFADVRARCEREPHLLRHGSGFILYALMDTVVDRYFPVVEALEDELEDLERRIFAGSTGRHTIEALYGLKQKITVLKHASSPLMESVGKLYGGRVPQVCANTQEYYRDIYDHLVRINQTIDSLRDTLATAISVNLSLITLQENETTKRLAAYAALVAVPTMIAGIYGMNFRHMPELDWALGYPLVVGIMFSIDGYLFWRFRKAKWL